jgi:hypothetical protein
LHEELLSRKELAENVRPKSRQIDGPSCHKSLA